jgi:AcrR family transcriptional regulator
MTAAGARARVRAELTREIVEAARRHLATEGATGLSLRAVARELGMASSAVYRYFASRDELLTALIVDAYDAIGAVAERAESAVARDDLRERWRATCRAAREWALAHPHEYALLYGSPVPGYAAPQATVAPAARVAALLCRVVADAVATGAIAPEPDGAAAGGVLTPGVAEGIGLPEPLAPRMVTAWSSLYGAISFEVFGQLTNVVEDRAAYFDAAVERLADLVLLP